MSTTQTYTACKPRHLIRRTARIHAAILNRRFYGHLPVPRSPRYAVKDSHRGPFRWTVVDWGTTGPR